MAKDKQENRATPRGLYIDFSHKCASDSSSAYQHKAELLAKYPAVPEELRENWARSDEENLQKWDWQDELRSTLNAIQKASTICKAFQSKRNPTDPATLANDIKAITIAIHKLTDIVRELRWKYPLPLQETYKSAAQHHDLQPHLPKLLLNSQDQILIYTPTLPPNYRDTNSIFFQEFHSFLNTKKLCQFEKWHCDFFHVYNERPEDIYDADNYFYKPIIDALTRAIGSRDCTDWFSYSKYNLHSQSIKAGSYIRITKRTEKVRFFQNFEKSVMEAETTENGS